MCVTGPEALIAAQTGMQAVGGLLEGVGLMEGADAQADAARRAAREERQAGSLEEQAYRRSMRDQLALKLLETTSTGGRVDTGSPLITMAREAGEREADAQLIRLGSSRRARTFDEQNEAAQFQKKLAFVTTGANVGATVLKGTSNFMEAGG